MVSLLQANYQEVTRANIRVLLSTKVPCINSLSRLAQPTNWKKSRFHLLAAGADNIATETSDNDSKSIEESYSKNGAPDNGTTVSSSTTDDKNLKQDESGPKSSTPQKRAPLTARERLRAARVLSRYTDTKPSKPERGNKLLDALQESDVKGKKLSGLPQAPTNLFDDSKRGMPKQGWTFELPVGLDVFFIAFSFVFISSVMFATTYLVWKVGAIHFNES